MERRNSRKPDKSEPDAGQEEGDGNESQPESQPTGGKGTPTSLTRNQAIIFEALKAEGGPVKAYDLLERVKEKGLRAPMTVYRALADLAKRGLVVKLESIKSYVACLPEDASVPVFLICENSGHSELVYDPKVEEAVRAMAQRKGFKLDRLRVEVTSYLCGS